MTMNRTRTDVHPSLEEPPALLPRPAFANTGSFFKAKAMKLWPTTPGDPTTPKGAAASFQQEVNPFDATIQAVATTTILLPTPGEGFADFNASTSTTPPTPGAVTAPNSVHHKLLNAQIPSLALPTLSRGTGDSTPSSGTPPSTLQPHAPPQTKLSTESPDFKPQAPPAFRRTHAPNSSSTNHPSTTSRGQVHVKLIQARGLSVRSHRSRPYVVVQFEQSEFVSREPIASETEKEVKGKAGPLSRTSSALALPVLNASGISRAFEAAARAKAAFAPGSTGSSSDSSSDGAATPGAGLFGSMSPHNPVWKHEVSFDVTSDQSYITFSIYDREIDGEGFVGRVEVKPVLVHDHTVDQWLKLQPRENEAVSGEIRLQITYEQFKNKRALTPRDFEFMKLIGRGTFGRVFQVRKKDTRRIYAMKVLSKKEIIAKKEVAHTIGERKILQRSLECPFLVGLKFSFQTETYLYLVTDFKSGGELFWHLQKETKFSEERARFYIAELVLALEHLHKYDIVYRDLKPENILLDATGHVALCDFGLSKPDLPADQLTNTFCGTTEYLAPEVLLDDHGYSKLVDFWSLGVLLFEMCCGWSPFYDEDTQQMYKNICFGKIKFPRGVIGEDGKQFVKGLLNRNPKHRLGAQRDTEELKEHPFFKSMDWALLAAKQVTPPFKPVVESDESTNNFDPEFTSADLRDTGIDIFDDDDPSDSWTASIGLNNGNTHQFNGPLSGLNASRSTTITAANGSTSSTTSSGNSATYSNGTRINGTASVATATAGSRPPSAPKRVPDNTPLSSSVQEHFRGFTYQGESTMEEAASEMFLHGSEEEMLDEEEIIDVDEADGDGEWEDEEPVGRYKKRNGRSHGSG